MQPVRRIGRRLSAAAVGATVLALVISTGAANAAGPTPTNQSLLDQPLPAQLQRALAGAQSSVPLTLVTGDRVHVGVDQDGAPVVREITAAPRAGGGTVAFHTLVRGDDVYVVPDDALSLLGGDVLDWQLFNLAELAAHAANGTIGEVPVIVSHPGHFRAGPAATAGVTPDTALPSIGATSMTIDGDGRWWREVRAATAGRAEPAAATRAGSGPLAGVEKVWLNPLLEVQLDESVPQINTEVAWGLGYDGTGVTVAVLDTGIDPNHPDVAGKLREQVDFTGAGSARDGHGHGTHVAATIAGTGAASDGLRPGVAPGADLLIGKVCSDGGSCPGDAIIAGMEWAAQSGAQVVSMSLGGGATDGTDPLSAAVNQLSLAHGTLFVIAAGNNGPASGTVGAPGAADEALTVAAVDKSDEMADFSSRGPRVGDGAPKPDIAAPGVNIVAARAEGTSMGTPVDELYTTASGTSMATPHVSGAAAIAAQQNPDLDGRQLKALLMGSALDLGHDLHAQGAGRVDVGRAVDPSVFSDGNVNFGRFTYPHRPVTETITYTNVTEAPVTLTLAGSMTAGDGTPAPAGLLALDSDQLTVPAGGTAELTLTLDGGAIGEDGVYGLYGGRVTATDSEGTLRASSRVSVFLEPERFPVTVEIVPPEGATNVSYGNLAVTAMDDQIHLHDDPATLPAAGGTATADLFAGVYAVSGSVTWDDSSGEEQLALPAAPEVTVAGPTTVQLDLRDARPVRVQAPEPTETYQATAGFLRTSATGEWEQGTTVSSSYADGEPAWWAVPTDPVSTGTFQFASQHVLVPPSITMKATGGGAPLALHPRYATPDVSVTGGVQQWAEGEQTRQREVVLPVPRLATDRPARLVHAGTGTPEELAGVPANRALVLLTPTDICPGRCDFVALRERVTAAAEAGAIGVLVAGETGRVDLGAPPSGTIDCVEGPESCPPVAPYAALPIVSLPADEAAELIDRARRPSAVWVTPAGDDALAEVYALSYTSDGRVPSRLPYRAGERDLQRVEHRIHADRPGAVSSFDWLRHEPGGSGATAFVSLPNVGTQRALTAYLGPRGGDAVDQFQVTTFAYLEPSIVDPSSVVTESQEYALDPDSNREKISWNVRPFVPGAAALTATDSGFVVQQSLFCAGCRQGDVLYPTMYRTTGAGHRTQLIGIVNDTGFTAFFLGIEPCQPPVCELRLYDEAGNELEQRLVRVEFGLGGREMDR